MHGSPQTLLAMPDHQLCTALLVGECAVGKTSFARQLCGLPFRRVYQPTIESSAAAADDASEDPLLDDDDAPWFDAGTMSVSGEPTTILLRDSSGLCTGPPEIVAPEADVVLLCFSLLSRTTLIHAVRTWLPAVRCGGRDPVVVLCGCKADLVGSRRHGGWVCDAVDEDEAAALAERCGLEYVRCSAAAARPRLGQGGCCCLLGRAQVEGWATPAEVLAGALRRVPPKTITTQHKAPHKELAPVMRPPAEASLGERSWIALREVIGTLQETMVLASE